MTNSRPAPARGLLLSFATALLMLVLLAVSPPAHAHDVLVESVPAEGAVLEESPDAIVLTFSGDVLELSPVILITAADGSGAGGGADPVVDGATVTLEVPDPMAAGSYEAAWRVVSSDGHPIEGVLAFSVAAGADDTPAPTPSTPPAVPGTDVTGEDAATPEEPAATQVTATDEASGLGALPLWLKIALVLAATAAVVGLIVITVRRSREGR